MANEELGLSENNTPPWPTVNWDELDITAPTAPGARTIPDDMPPERPITSFQDTNLFIDPNTSALFETGLRTGDTSSLAAPFFRTQEEQQAEVGQRAEVLRTGVEATGKAAILAGSEQARRTFQRQGKALSSAVVFGEGGLLDVSEQAKYQSEATFAQGLSDIFAQVGQEYGAREALGADILQTQVGAYTQRQVANIQATTAGLIAQIEADVALSVEDKRTARQRAINESNEAIANIGSYAQLYSTYTNAVANVGIAKKQLEAGSITNEELNKTERERIAAQERINALATLRGMSGDVDLRENLPDGTPNPNYLKPTDVTLQGNEHSFQTVDDPDSAWNGMPSWMVGYTIEDLSVDNAYKIAMDTIEKDYYKIDLASADGWAQFTASQEFLREQFNISTAQEWAMFEKTIELQVRDQNINISQFAQTLSNAKEQAWYEDDRVRDLTVLTLSTDLQKNYLNNTQQWAMWRGDMNANLLELGIRTEEQHWYATETLKQSLYGIEDNRMRTIASTTLSFMQDPVFMQTALGATIDEDGLVTFDNTLYNAEGNVVPEGTAGGMTRADRMLSTLFPAIEGMFFRTFDADGNGIVGADEGGGTGAQVSNGVLAKNLALEFGLDPANYPEVNDIVRALANGEIPEGIIPDYEPLADDYVLDDSSDTGYVNPGDTSGDIADDIFNDVGTGVDTSGYTPGHIGEIDITKLTPAQRKYRTKMAIAVTQAGYTSYEELPPHIQAKYNDAITQTDSNERLFGQEHLIFWLNKNPKGGE